MRLPCRPAERRSSRETKDELFHGFKSLSAAEGKLMLVAEKQGAAALREYGEAVVAFRRSYYMGNKVMTEEQLDSAKSQISQSEGDVFFDIVQRIRMMEIASNEDFTVSESTAVSMMAPPMGPEAACAASLRPARWHSVPRSVK